MGQGLIFKHLRRSDMSWLVRSFLPGCILCWGLEDERSWKN